MAGRGRRVFFCAGGSSYLGTRATRTQARAVGVFRNQALGALIGGNGLEKVGRYEVALDRQLERTLAILLKYQDLRPGNARS